MAESCTQLAEAHHFGLRPEDAVPRRSQELDRADEGAPVAERLDVDGDRALLIQRVESVLQQGERYRRAHGRAFSTDDYGVGVHTEHDVRPAGDGLNRRSDERNDDRAGVGCAGHVRIIGRALGRTSALGERSNFPCPRR